jgi:hypothetical protein
MTQRLLALAGIGEERLHLAWVSSAEAQRFVGVATSITESIRSQGALDTDAMEMELSACGMTVNSEALRWLVGKEVTITSDGDVYGRTWSAERYRDVLDYILEREYHKNLIYLSLKKGCTSVRDISHRIGLDLKRISYLLADLEKTNRVEFKGMEDSKPVFAVL